MKVWRRLYAEGESLWVRVRIKAWRRWYVEGEG